MPDALHLDHLAVLLLLVHTSYLWWRLNRRRVKGWLQMVKDLERRNSSVWAEI